MVYFLLLQKNEIFADVKELNTERKLVKTVCEQEECESRRVWRDVTVGLRINDMDKATAAKCAIEQKQRDEARVRKENNLTWQTKVSGLFFARFFFAACRVNYANQFFFLCLNSSSRKPKTVVGCT